MTIPALLPALWSLITGAGALAQLWVAVALAFGFLCFGTLLAASVRYELRRAHLDGALRLSAHAATRRATLWRSL